MEREARRDECQAHVAPRVADKLSLIGNTEGMGRGGYCNQTCGQRSRYESIFSNACRRSSMIRRIASGSTFCSRQP